MKSHVNIVSGNAKVAIQHNSKSKCLDGQPGCDGGPVCKALMKKRRELEAKGIEVLTYRGR